VTPSDEHIGKTILLGLTWVATDKSERHEQFAGTISGFNMERPAVPLVIIACDDGVARNYPWSELSVSMAPEGEYKLAKSQTVYVNPHFLMQFTIYPKPES
jgi:hypothetical protein